MKNELEIKAYLEGLKTSKDFNRGVNGIYSDYQKGVFETIRWILDDPEQS